MLALGTAPDREIKWDDFAFFEAAPLWYFRDLRALRDIVDRQIEVELEDSRMSAARLGGQVQGPRRKTPSRSDVVLDVTCAPDESVDDALTRSIRLWEEGHPSTGPFDCKRMLVAVRVGYPLAPDGYLHHESCRTGRAVRTQPTGAGTGGGRPVSFRFRPFLPEGAVEDVFHQEARVLIRLREEAGLPHPERDGHLGWTGVWRLLLAQEADALREGLIARLKTGEMQSRRMGEARALDEEEARADDEEEEHAAGAHRTGGNGKCPANECAKPKEARTLCPKLSEAGGKAAQGGFLTPEKSMKSLVVADIKSLGEFKPKSKGSGTGQPATAAAETKQSDAGRRQAHGGAGAGAGRTATEDTPGDKSYADPLLEYRELLRTEPDLLADPDLDGDESWRSVPEGTGPRHLKTTVLL